MVASGTTSIGLGRLARPAGTFAMLAIDQRETLRALLVESLGNPVDDAELVQFKVEITRALTPFASAVLIDTVYGLDAAEQAGARAPGCGLIVAADHFVQSAGGPVEWADLDTAAGQQAVDAGADALKLLVPWRRGEEVDARARLVEGFVRLCRRHGLLAVLEGVVRGPRGGGEPPVGGSFDDALLEAALELCAFEPDLYKAEVPTLGTGSDEEIERQAAELSRTVARPWVVLSAGVALDRFEDAARAAFRGGASGFLAGRGIWRPALAPESRSRALEELVRPRLERLAAAVDELACPWPEASSPAR